MYKRSHIMLFGLSLFLLVVLAVYVGYEAWLLSFFIILFLISLLVAVIIGLIIMPFYKKTTILLNRFGVYPGNLFQFSKALDSLEKILVKKQLEIEQIPITIAEKIRSQEYIDNQTQLGNRRFFDARLDELLLTQSHSGTGVVILLSLTELQKTKEKN